ncbi:MAG: niaR [Firmicutes bacterium]|nr:niaR [Bacillota bacterium]
MEAKRRRQALMEILCSSSEPLTGSALAKELGVSRQIIVGDIAILRAAGAEVYATPQGYLLPKIQKNTPFVARFACVHDREKLGRELAIIIDNGGKVLDVIVEHTIYGEIKANLMLTNRRELREFLDKLDKGAEPLSAVTGGAHLHTVEASSQNVLDTIEAELKAEGILLN